MLAEKLAISTDKTEYTQGETIKIVIISGSEYPLVQESDDLAGIVYSEYFGNNYGVGFIEKNINGEPASLSALTQGEQDERGEPASSRQRGEWAVIEPVWRCDNSCFVECKYDHSINPGDSKIFKWKQTVLKCDRQKRIEEVEDAGPGRYRISSGFWNEQEQKNKVIYSNEFVIK